MRQNVIFGQSIPRDGDTSSDTAMAKLATQLSDARENATPQAVKIGHPSGAIDVPGKRGWIYAQKVAPEGGAPAVLEVFVPSGRTGKNRIKFVAGSAIPVSRATDTNPTYYYYDGIPPSTRIKKKPPGSGLTQAGGYWKDAGNPCCGPSWSCGGTLPSTGGGTIPGYGSGGSPDNPPDRPITPGGDTDDDPGWNEDDPKTRPIRSKDMPALQRDGDLWDNGEFIRRFNWPSNDLEMPGSYDILQGHTSGIFFEGKATSAITKLRAVCLDETKRKIIPAGSNLPVTKGKIQGIALANTVEGGICPVQKTGIAFYLGNSFSPGLPIYAGAGGTLTQTKPVSGYVQRVAWGYDNQKIVVDIGEVEELEGDVLVSNATGSTINKGKWVYLDSTGMHLADFSSSGTHPAEGVLLEDCPTGESRYVRRFGLADIFTGLTEGVTYFGDPATSGGYAASPTVGAGAKLQELMVARTATAAFIKPGTAFKAGGEISLAVADNAIQIISPVQVHRGTYGYPGIVINATTDLLADILSGSNITVTELRLSVKQDNAGSGTDYYSWTLGTFGIASGTVDSQSVAAGVWADFVYSSFTTATATPPANPTLSFTKHGTPGNLAVIALIKFTS